MSMTFDYEEFLLHIWEDVAFLDTDSRLAEIVQVEREEVRDPDIYDSHPW
jgi:hypothetical protein